MNEQRFVVGRLRDIRDLSEFPGWARFPQYLRTFIDGSRPFAVLDIGGGANPMVERATGDLLSYTLLDIDQLELDKAPPVYDRRICADATDQTDTFLKLVGERHFDLVYSHMFLEHIKNPDQVHRNIYAALKPGGWAVHAYPIDNNFPLMFNSLVPEAISRRIITTIDPKRHSEGSLGKFPAFYKKCFAPGQKARTYYESHGYRVVSHVGYAGHRYYDRFPPLRRLERRFRKLVIRNQWSWICFGLLVVQRPGAETKRYGSLE